MNMEGPWRRTQIAGEYMYCFVKWNECRMSMTIASRSAIFG
jgi:hypothetical protein